MKYFEVEIADGLRVPCENPDGLDIVSGDEVVIKLPRYEDFGRVRRLLREIRVKDENKRGMILRQATDNDRACAEKFRLEEADKERQALEEIRELKLKMKVIKTHCSMDGAQVIFLFTADGRVDFRELVKRLSRRLSRRIELRQVGVRDETAVIGGIGPCGRPFCCKTFLHEFDSINVRTAKDQGLTLNPATISGMCGRLKCCLKFEHSCYKEESKGLPKLGQDVTTTQGPGTVVEVNILKKELRVQLKGRNEKIVTVPASECKFKGHGCGGCCGKDDTNKENE